MDKKYIESFDGLFKGSKITTFFDSNNKLANSFRTRIFDNAEKLEETVYFGENTIEVIGVADGISVRTVKTFDNYNRPTNLYYESTVVTDGKMFTSVASVETTELSGRDSVSKIIYTDAVVPTGRAKRAGEEDVIVKNSGEIIFDNTTQTAVVSARTRIKEEGYSTHSFISSSITLENGLTEVIINPVVPDGFVPQTIQGVVPFRDALARMPHSIGNYHMEGGLSPLSEVENRPIFDSKSFEGAEALEYGERVVSPSEIAFTYINADSIAAKLAEEDVQ